ncbi:MAG: hypothetical protein Q8P31_06395 [Bacillota bacterium]|nr:hypothetical protein [Bacillota bacterium]
MVLRELAAQQGLGFIDRSLYLWCLFFRPKNIRQIAAALDLSWATVAKACERLEATDWMRMSKQPGRRICPIPTIPIRCEVEMAQLLEVEYGFAPNRGEFLMKRHLDMWVWSDAYVDNARPDFLRPTEDAPPLEYDRFYYQAKVAFEFNGSQHYSASSTFGEDKGFRETRNHDLAKLALSQQQGVSLITVSAEDLAPEAFRRLLPDNLALNYVNEDGPYYKTLARISLAYAAKTGRLDRQQQRRSPGDKT